MNLNTDKLKQQIQTLDTIIEWVNKNLTSTERTEYFKYLVEKRRMFKRKYNSATVNPTIAAYGESQKGKSYIVTSLLSSPEHPLCVTDEDGDKLNFIDNFNQKTKNQESTGVITRFSTDTVSDDPKHPIKIRTMSLADIITMLADSYVNSVKGYKNYEKSELQQIGQELTNRYADKQNVQKVVTEDEVGDIEEYLMYSNPTATVNFKDSGWFDCMALTVRKIPCENLADEFAWLWRHDATFTALLKILITNYQKINFSRELYIDTKPVLNSLCPKRSKSDTSFTLMTVASLIDKEYGILPFFKSGGQGKCPVQVMLDKQQSAVVDKAFLSLITAEVIYHVDRQDLEAPIRFNFDKIHGSKTTSMSASQVVEHLKSKYHLDEPANRSFLYKTGADDSVCFDLLDFPGAREMRKIDSPDNVEKELPELMLREKVFYMFQKYSREGLISILLFCHDHTNGVTGGEIANHLSGWVEECVGKDVDTRSKRIADYKISPLFVISTKYNTDLVVTKKPGQEWCPDISIFKQRFTLRLLGEAILPGSHDWFDHWTKAGSFDNTFLLRDYAYSSDQTLQIEGASCLFSGYPGQEKEELNEEERQQIKEMFLQSDDVKRFFRDPELAWDVASTVGNDGAYWLFKQILTLAPNVQTARTNAIRDEIERFQEEVIKKIDPKFHRNDRTKDLEDSIKSARRLKFVMSSLLEKHQDFFGRFIQHLQLTPNYTDELFTNMIHSIKLPDKSSSHQYETIIKGVENDGYSFRKDDEQYNMDVLNKVFGIEGKDDPMLEGIDLNVLFGQDFQDNISPAHIMARELIDKWLQHLASPENSIYFSSIKFNSSVLAEFNNRFKSMIAHVRLADRIAEAIREYVDFTDAIEPKIIPLIADIATNIFNTFVMDMGYKYLTEQELADAKTHSEKYNIKLSDNYSIKELETADADVRKKLFESLEALGSGESGQLLQLPSYKNMNKWLELVTISYIANFAIEDWGYTKEENARLGKLIKQFQDEQQ